VRRGSSAERTLPPPPLPTGTVEYCHAVGGTATRTTEHPLLATFVEFAQRFIGQDRRARSSLDLQPALAYHLFSVDGAPRCLDVRPAAVAGGDAATRLAARLAGASPPKASTAEVAEGEFPPLPPSGLRFAPTPTPEALGRRVGNAACEAVLRAAAAERSTQPAPRALGAAAAADDDDASARALLTVLRRIGAALEAQRDLSLRLAPRPLEEVLLMADFLGVPYGGDRGSELLWIADAALCSELPLGWAEHVTDDGTPYYHSLWSSKVMWEHPQRAWLRGVATAAREGAALLAHTGYT